MFDFCFHRSVFFRIFRRAQRKALSVLVHEAKVLMCESSKMRHWCAKSATKYSGRRVEWKLHVLSVWIKLIVSFGNV